MNAYIELGRFLAVYSSCACNISIYSMCIAAVASVRGVKGGYPHLQFIYAKSHMLLRIKSSRPKIIDGIHTMHNIYTAQQ